MEIIKRLSYFTIGGWPVGSALSAIILLVGATIAALLYWNVFELFPRWIDKLVILVCMVWIGGSISMKRQQADQNLK
jgi:hypothetical protein